MNLSIFTWRLIVLRLHYVCPVAILLLSVGATGPLHGRDPLVDRWFYASKNLADENQAKILLGLIDTAASHGLNGVLLSAGFDRLDRQQPRYFANLEKLKARCRERGVEIIPCIFSVGYGGSLLARNPNLAAGLPVRDAPFLARGRSANLTPDPSLRIENGDFERWKGERALDFDFHDQPGKITFADTDVFKSGRRSIRFESFENDPVHGHARLMQRVGVHPRRAYSLSLWVKTQDLAGGAFRVQVLTEKRALAPYDPRVPATSDWRQVRVVFNSMDNAEVRVYAGVWGARSGRFWIDDMKIEEIGMVNVLRRAGTPIRVEGAENGLVYEEERDFERVEDPRMRPSEPYHEPPAIRLTPNSRIQEGERLSVSWFHPVVINRGQVTACMSEPEIHEIWREQAELLRRHLAPRKYFLGMDEIRAGGTCEACRERNMSMGEILGDCVAKQYETIKAADPKAEVYIWSDMFDPNHNARDGYYMVEGDFKGSWNHIPKDIIVACWYHRIRDKSLEHFSRLGFRTIGAAYYDADDLENCREWLTSLRATPDARGVMYTSWRNKYDLLGPFGNLLADDAKE